MLSSCTNQIRLIKVYRKRKYYLCKRDGDVLPNDVPNRTGLCAHLDLKFLCFLLLRLDLRVDLFLCRYQVIRGLFRLVIACPSSSQIPQKKRSTNLFLRRYLLLHLIHLFPQRIRLKVHCIPFDESPARSSMKNALFTQSAYIWIISSTSSTE